mmetsp:Transcript_2082/g.5600  ORF Transcript_2082/g.5600 Transcript_2082/m.5600 type:complete len:84 (-) Transcript_2082:596-847(-)
MCTAILLRDARGEKIAHHEHRKSIAISAAMSVAFRAALSVAHLLRKNARAELCEREWLVVRRSSQRHFVEREEQRFRADWRFR